MTPIQAYIRNHARPCRLFLGFGLLFNLALLPYLFIGHYGIMEKIVSGICVLIMARFLLDANAWVQVDSIRRRAIHVSGVGSLASAAMNLESFLGGIGAAIVRDASNAEFKIILKESGGKELLRMEDQNGNHAEDKLIHHGWLQSVGFHLGRFIRTSDKVASS